jgi:hypothetical protein
VLEAGAPLFVADLLAAPACEPDEAGILPLAADVVLGWFGFGATLAAAAYRSAEANVSQSDEAGIRGV